MADQLCGYHAADLRLSFHIYIYIWIKAELLMTQLNNALAYLKRTHLEMPMAILVDMGRKKTGHGKNVKFCDTYHIQCVVRWPSCEAVFKWNFTIISEILHQ